MGQNDIRIIVKMTHIHQLSFANVVSPHDHNYTQSLLLLEVASARVQRPRYTIWYTVLVFASPLE